MAKDHKDAKERIIDVAQRMFARFGFRKTTMDEIAQAARKGKSSIYHYFKSKEEIMQAVMEKEVRVAKEEINKAIAEENTPQGKLRAYVLTRMQVLNRLANLYSAFKDEYLENYQFIERIRINYDQYEINIIKDILQEGIKERIFVVKDLEITAYAIVTAEKGLEYTMAVEKDLNKIEENINNLLEILFYGIVKR